MTAKNDEIIDLLSNYNSNQCFFQKINRKIWKFLIIIGKGIDLGQ